MQNSESNSTRPRHLTLLAALTLGVVGGAAADAVITLRSGHAMGIDSAVATRNVGASDAAASAAGTDVADEMTAAGACSCVEGVAPEDARSPLAPRRGLKRHTHRTATAPVDLCSATVAPGQ